MFDDVRKRAADLLSSGEVRVVVGYCRGRRDDKPAPFFARTAQDCEKLIVNSRCQCGLAVYARREAAGAPAAFVAGAGDIKALKVLVQEGQIESENIRVIAFHCDIPGSPLGRVSLVEGSRLEDFESLDGPAANGLLTDEIARIAAMSPSQRWSYWRGQFDKCVRCYACRAACPMCYCDECIVERNQPQWIEALPRPRGNFAWNLIRAWHLAGRCVECAACARACPEGIRLDVLNHMIAGEVFEAFGYVPGEGALDESGLFASFREDDSETFIFEP